MAANYFHGLTRTLAIAFEKHFRGSEAPGSSSIGFDWRSGHAGVRPGCSDGDEPPSPGVVSGVSYIVRLCVRFLFRDFNRSARSVVVLLKILENPMRMFVRRSCMLTV